MYTTPEASLPWVKFLLMHSVLQFSIPQDCLRVAGKPWSYPGGFMIVVAQFGRNMRFKAKRRKEKVLSLSRIPALDNNIFPRKLKVVPAVVARVSPLADELGPSQSDDTCPASPPFSNIAADGSSVALPPRPPSKWCVEKWRPVAATFPNRRVAELALQVLSDELDVFCGVREKPVDFPPRPPPDVGGEVMRAAMLKSVSKGFSSGPLKANPLPFSRVCDVSSIPKDKNDPTTWADQRRVVSNFSRAPRGGCSVNDLCWAPLLLTFYMQVLHIRDTVGELGPCSAFGADIPSCFKQNRNSLAALA
jgi:hypothetical protein